MVRPLIRRVIQQWGVQDLTVEDNPRSGASVIEEKEERKDEGPMVLDDIKALIEKLKNKEYWSAFVLATKIVAQLITLFGPPVALRTIKVTSFSSRQTMFPPEILFKDISDLTTDLETKVSQVAPSMLTEAGTVNTDSLKAISGDLIVLIMEIIKKLLHSEL